MPASAYSCLAFLIPIFFPALVLAQVTPPPTPSKTANRPVERGEPQWFKGNLHAHSLWSDGNDFPEMIAEWYHRHRYNFLALSEHDTLSQGERWIAVDHAKSRAQRDIITRCRERFGNAWVESRVEAGVPQVRLKPFDEYRTLFERPGHFLLLQGEEITDKLGTKPIHANATNLQETIAPQGGKDVLEILSNDFAAIEAQSLKQNRPILAHLNHPSFWYAITAEEMAAAKGVRLVEIYNGHPGTNQLGDDEHAGVERIWDIANTLRIAERNQAPLFGLASDDAHDFGPQGLCTPGRGWIMVRSRYLTPGMLIRAIEAGDFYASTGVTLKNLKYSADSNSLELEITPHGQAVYTTQFIGTEKGFDPGRTPVIGKNGQPLAGTQKYSEEVGKVLATVEGLKPSFQLTGREYYVRAVVTSDQPPINPTFKDQKAQAWTQPVGWEKWVSKTSATPTSAAK